MKNNKYKYLKVIQQNYGFGWEDNSEYETDSKGYCVERVKRLNKYGRMQNFSLCSEDYKEYVLTGYATRIINRKELNQLTTS
jgi:hypothetical protein